MRPAGLIGFAPLDRRGGGVFVGGLTGGNGRIAVIRPSAETADGDVVDAAPNASTLAQTASGSLCATHNLGASARQAPEPAERLPLKMAR